MNLQPLAFIVFLNLNVEFFEPLELLDTADVSLECFLATAVETACDYSDAHATEFVPPDNHNNQHDQIKQGQLQDHEKYVSDSKAKNSREKVQDNAHENGTLLDLRVVIRIKACVQLLEFTPVHLVLYVIAAQLTNVLLFKLKDTLV